MTLPNFGVAGMPEASTAECEKLERLATDLVSGVLPSRIRTHARAIIGLTRLEFQLTEYTEEGISQSAASAALYDETDDDYPIAEIIVATDNSVLANDPPASHQLARAVSLIGELVKSGELNEKEKRVAGHVAGLIFCVMDDVEPENEAYVEVSGGQSSLFEMLNEIIDESEAPVMEVREHAHPVSDDCVLAVTEYSYPNIVDPLMLHAYDDEPRLEIELEDRVKITKHSYVVTFADSRSYIKYNPTEVHSEFATIKTENTDFVTSQRGDEAEKDEFMPPSQAGVEVLTDAVIEAIELDLGCDSLEADFYAFLAPPPRS